MSNKSKVRELYRTIIYIAVVVVLIMAGRGIQSSLSSRTPKVKQISFQNAKKAVKTSPVRYSNKSITVGGIGKVLSSETVDLITEVQGEIKKGDVNLKSAQNFRQGQVLFRIDDEEAKLSLNAQKSNFLTAIAGILPDLEVDYPNAFPKWKAYFDQLDVNQPLPALPEINSSQEKVFFSTRNIMNQFYTIKSTEERLTKYTIRAPFSGTFQQVFQENGSVANPGTRIATIIRSGALEIETPISRGDIGYVKKGLKVSIYTENGEKKYTGIVRRISSLIDAATQSINIYVSINGNSREIFEGQYLRVEIPGERVKEVMEIPRSAIFAQNKVYIVEDSTLLSKAINVEKFNEETAFFSGLEPGTEIVVEPLVNAFDNMPVRTIRIDAPKTE